MRSKKQIPALTRFLLKWLGGIATILLAVAAFSPNTVDIPLAARPWLFMAFIFWSITICSGVFTI